MTQFFTVGQLAERYGQPEWKVRSAVDSLTPAVPRAGQYRLVPAESLPALAAKLAPATKVAEAVA